MLFEMMGWVCFYRELRVKYWLQSVLHLLSLFPSNAPFLPSSIKRIELHNKVVCYPTNVLGDVGMELCERWSVKWRLFPAFLHHCVTVTNFMVQIKKFPTKLLTSLQNKHYCMAEAISLPFPMIASEHEG